MRRNLLPSTCEIHGKPTKRATCHRCNAAYMRTYLRGRRVQAPELTIWQRAHRRAASRGVRFSIPVQSIVIPAICPVLGIPIVLGEARSENSPSLDRTVPERGYVSGNVRVISDRANRLKADLTITQLENKTMTGPEHLREDYRLIAAYVRREILLGDLRDKLLHLGATEEDWMTIASLLGDRESSRNRKMKTESLTSQMIEDEFGLTKKQVLMLRRLADFPRPQRKRDGFRFNRAEVEQWIGSQPDPSRPAAVLELHKRPRCAVNSKAAVLLRSQYAGASRSEDHLGKPLTGPRCR